ncbi:MAG: sigma-70 family RNA polymerase sigma factor [Nibricoccus sp.]
MQDDLELLRRFAEQGSQEAFTELVRQKMNLVYAAALRQTGGDAHLACDVTQGVFLALAAQADALKGHTLLIGWLYTTTRNLAINAVRNQVRWQRREQEVNRMNATSSDPKPAWEELRPVIDEAMHELAEKDRTALLLRFFEDRSFAEVGAAVGVAENAARMRVDRALEKLRSRLASRRVTSTAVALGIALAEQPIIAAPAGLAATIASSSLAGGVFAKSGSLLGIGFMNTTKVIAVSACLAAIAGFGGYVLGDAHRVRNEVRPSPPQNNPALAALNEENRHLRDENEQLRNAQTSIANQNGVKGAAALQRLSVLSEAQKSGLLLNTRVPFVSVFGKLTPKFAELFMLSPAELETMQQSLDVAHSRVDQLALANASAATMPDGKVVIEVKPFEGGGPIYDAMMDTFTSLLGKERSDAFLQLVGSQLGDELYQFGAEQRTITLTPAGEKNDALTYDLVDQHKLANPVSTAFSSGTALSTEPRGNSLGRTSTMKGLTRDRVASRLGVLSGLVPSSP